MAKRLGDYESNKEIWDTHTVINLDDKIQERIRRDDAIFQDLHPDVVICTDRRSAEETGRTIFALAEVFMTDHTQP